MIKFMFDCAKPQFIDLLALENHQEFKIQHKNTPKINLKIEPKF